MAIIDGTDSNDKLSGTAGDDTIDAKLGDDIITTNRGFDVVDGGDGDDTLRINWSGETRDVYIENGRALPGTRAWVNTGTAWADSTRAILHNRIEHYDVRSGSGNDTLNGWANLWDRFDGGAGVDFWTDDFSGLTAGMVVNMALVSSVDGQSFADGTEVANIERAWLSLTQGNDRFRDFGNYGDSIWTAEGNDHVHFSRGDDYANGGAGDDVLHIDYSDTRFAVYVDNNRGLPGTRVYEDSAGSWADATRRVLHNDFEHYDVKSGAGDDDLAGWTGAWDRFDGGDGVDLWRDSFAGAAEGVRIYMGKMATRDGQTLKDGTHIAQVEHAVLTLSDHDDVFRDTGRYADSIGSGGGNDIVAFSGGDDYANGGDGDDVLRIDWSDATGAVYIDNWRGLPGTRAYVENGGGWSGADTRVLHNGFEHFDVRGGSGDDTFWGWSNLWDRFNGGAGIDTWHDRFDAFGSGIAVNMAQANTASGLKIADGSWIKAIEAADLYLTEHADTFKDAGPYSDLVRALGGDDDITTSNGRDYANGGDGVDTLRVAWGDATHDVYLINWYDHYGWEKTTASYSDSTRVVEFAYIEQIVARLGRGNDVVSLGNGADVVKSGGGRDDITLRGGNDLAAGGAGSDTIRGGDDRDVLYGNGGADTLLGEAGNDALLGGVGNDRLTGGDGNDVLTGGKHADTFVYEDLDEGTDRIRDFGRGADVIDLSALDLALGDIRISGYDGGASTRISFGTTEIRLEGYDKALVDTGDFLFA